MSVRFRFDWVDAPPAPDERAHTTMAELSIRVGNVTITDVLDRPHRINRDHVVVPLCCVAEWLTCNWWHIFHEVEDTREQKPDFEARHDLAFAGDGFVLPRLAMAPTPERMRLRWSPYKPPHAPIEFVAEEGETDVARADLEGQCRNLIEAALERLRSRGIDSGAFADEWTAINTLDPDERAFARAAALLGVDPFGVSDHVADAITGLWEGADPSLRDDALAAASADSVPRMSAWLTRSLEALERAESGGDWPVIRQALPQGTAAAPWEQGYDLARTARNRIGAGDGRFDFPPTGPLSLRWSETQPPSARIHGLTAADAPSCMTALRSETGKRFLLARALGDYLDRSEPGPALLSSLATNRQARSRAFAAEFLAPAESLRRRLNGGPVEPETVDELGIEFGVSSLVIRHQIENHRLATLAGW